MHTAERTLFRDVPLPVSRTPEEKLRAIILPGTTTFQGTSFYDALAYLRQEAARLDEEEEGRLAALEEEKTEKNSKPAERWDVYTPSANCSCW